MTDNTPLDLDALAKVAREAPYQGGWYRFGGAAEKLLSIFPRLGKSTDLVHWTGFDGSLAAKSWPDRERLADHIATFDPPTVLALIKAARSPALDASQAMEGWKLVPVKCTDEIAEAIVGVVNMCGGLAESTWSAALAAAPPPPIQGVGKDQGAAQDHALAASGEVVRLADCPPGLFLFDGSLGFKTEYGASVGKDVGGGKVEWTVTNLPDAYVVESGEFFWGGVKTHAERAELRVLPLSTPPTTDASRAPGLHPDPVPPDDLVEVVAQYLLDVATEVQTLAIGTVGRRELARTRAKALIQAHLTGARS